MTVEPLKGGALEGVTIVDMTRMLAGPFATMLLADQGAHVIKIEALEGDYPRFNNPFHPDDTEHSVSGFYASVNRNKKNIAVDLKKPEAREIVLKLCESADAIIENFRPGVMDRLGLSYEELHERFPKLVYAAVRGFGDPRTGDNNYVDWPSYDPISQAMGGMMGITGPDADTPTKIGPGVGDTIPSMMAAFGVVCAIVNARATGRGQFVDVGMVDAVLSACERIVHQKAFQNVVAKPVGNRHPMFAPFGIVPAKNGHVTLAAQSDDWWAKLCTLIGRSDLITDARSANAPARVANQDFVYGEIGKETSKYTKAELMEKLGGKIPIGPVNTVDDIFSDPYFAARGMIVDVDHPGCPSPVKTTGVPIKMTETPGRVWHRAARLGEHTDAILETLGYGPEAIATLRQNRVIA